MKKKPYAFQARLLFGLLMLIPLFLMHSCKEHDKEKAVGNFIKLNGVNFYYEVRGEGDPLLILHGNGGGMNGMKNQIDYFSKRYQVIAMDCRGRGKSEMGTDSLTYMQMARDAMDLITYLKVDSTHILGYSDGGIIALLMGIYFPERVKKIVCFGANLTSDTSALYTSSVLDIKQERLLAEAMILKKDSSKDWATQRQRYRLMEFQPNITGSDLGKIKAPVLVMSTDRDLIREEHTFFIYKHIPLANLSIFPGETHRVIYTNSALFNSTAQRFLSEKFKADKTRFPD